MRIVRELLSGLREHVGDVVDGGFEFVEEELHWGFWTAAGRAQALRRDWTVTETTTLESCFVMGLGETATYFLKYVAVSFTETVKSSGPFFFRALCHSQEEL